MFIVSFASVSAQDIDVDNLDNEELLALVQAIMQKLENEGSAELTAEEPEQPAVTDFGEESGPDPVGFEIYKNKKIMVEALPAYMFIQKPSGKDKDDKGSEDKPRNYKDDFIALIEKYGETVEGELEYYRNEKDFISEETYNNALNFYSRGSGN